MYIRFQGKRNNDSSSSKLGIFQLAYELRDNEDTPKYAHDEIQNILSWLDDNMEAPEILDDGKHHRAILWFKAEAKKQIDKIRAMKAILEEFGYHIDQITTKEPGLIIYEDDCQIVAKPKK